MLASTDNVDLLKAKEKEPIASFLKMKLVELTPGYSRVTMNSRPNILTSTGWFSGGLSWPLPTRPLPTPLTPGKPQYRHTIKYTDFRCRCG